MFNTHFYLISILETILFCSFYKQPCTGETVKSYSMYFVSQKKFCIYIWALHPDGKMISQRNTWLYLDHLSSPSRDLQNIDGFQLCEDKYK